MSAKVFVTHSQHDIEFARRLCSDLASQSLEIWFDDRTLKGGERLAEEINRGLAWCDVYVPIISRASLASKWCWEEMNAALALCNLPTRGKQLRIIPVLAEDCPNEMPPSFLSRLYFSFAGRYSTALRDLLQKGLGVEPAAPPSTTPQTDVRIQRLQSALHRLATPLRALDDDAHKIADAVRELAGLPDRWRDRVPDHELLRRLEGLTKITDLLIAASPHMYSLSSFLTTYGNPQFGIGARNVEQALDAYRTMVNEANSGADWASDLLKAVREETPLPKEMSESLTRLITHTRDQVNLLRAEIAKLEQI